MEKPDNDDRPDHIRAIGNRIVQLSVDDGNRIVLRRLVNGSAVGLTPFTGQHGHPERPSSIVDVLWFRDDWLADHGNPETITITVEPGGFPVPAPITDGEQEDLNVYDRQRQQEMLAHQAEIEREHAEGEIKHG